MDQVKAKVKPLYAQIAHAVVTGLLIILLIVAVAVDKWEKAAVKASGYGISVNMGVAGGLTTDGFSNAPAWAQATYILLIFSILFQGAALLMHLGFRFKPALKPKLFIAMAALNGVTFFITALALGLWNSKGSVPLTSYATSYQCLGACIFFEILNFILLFLLKFFGGV